VGPKHEAQQEEEEEIKEGFLFIVVFKDYS
jgi:hypothetical protein